MEHQELIEKINKLKKEKNAIILVHNYQREEIYEIANFMGDSLELCKKAVNADAKIIVFCGVDFMAESAKILNPEKKVLLPDNLSQCPMANMVKVEEVIAMKKKHPEAVVVSYVNTTADVKAVSDVCCTSANAINVVRALKEKEIIFVPDRNLGSYVQSQLPDKKIILVEGHCYVHDEIIADSVREAKENHPEAEVLVHPECKMEVNNLADYVCSTSQMIKRVKESSANEFIIVTECGMVNALKRERKDAKYYAGGGVCIQMKKVTLQKVYDCLLNGTHQIELDNEVMEKAKKALDRMLEVS
ncbi:MAG: quinolinate synthase NadA [Nanoarchaeota archaeon]|nr:quinolinate synthase NadA [Nanoarchaeota archaeon]